MVTLTFGRGDWRCLRRPSLAKILMAEGFVMDGEQCHLYAPSAQHQGFPLFIAACPLPGRQLRACRRSYSIFFMAGFLLFSMTVYLRKISRKEPFPLVWPRNQTRDSNVFIRPERQTAILIPRNACYFKRESDGNVGERDASVEDGVYLIVAVSSSSKNLVRRQAIRNSWAKDQKYLKDVRVVFVVGKPLNDTTLQARLTDESELHGDILQEDFTDTYGNLTIKSLMVLKWYVVWCEGVPYILKTDDDMYINLRNLYSLARDNQTPQLVLGSRICGAVPITDPSFKYYCPPYMYSDTYYPNYISGTAYLLSRSTALFLQQMSFHVPMFHMEDIYITGILSAKAREVSSVGELDASFRPKDDVRFSIVKTALNPCLYSKIIASHHLTPREMLRMYNGVVDVHAKPTMCTKMKAESLRSYPPDKCTWKEPKN